MDLVPLIPDDIPILAVIRRDASSNPCGTQPDAKWTRNEEDFTSGARSESETAANLLRAEGIWHTGPIVEEAFVVFDMGEACTMKPKPCS